MIQATEHPWQSLFAAAPMPAGLATSKWFMLSKRGHPWLLLPGERKLACQALDLYPAQTAKARAARQVLRLALGCGWYPRSRTLDLARCPDSLWEQFLQRLAGGHRMPVWVSLAGNPNATGQRLVILVFDPKGSPGWVVKVGVGGRAAVLIAAERSILQQLPSTTPGVPVLRGEFSVGDLQAFALDYALGAAPKAPDDAAPATLLRQWIQPGDPQAVTEWPVWRALREQCQNHPWFTAGQAAVAKQRVRPVLMHGDFAPWNIRVAPTDGRWLVLDWERATLQGIPGWDWFHFVIQPEILVRRRPVADIVQRLRGLLRGPEFQEYARATLISGIEVQLLRAYLAYQVCVIQPTEGVAVTQQLLEVFQP